MLVCMYVCEKEYMFIHELITIGFAKCPYKTEPRDAKPERKENDNCVQSIISV